jgi:hypothetical protein
LAKAARSLHLEASGSCGVAHLKRRTISRAHHRAAAVESVDADTVRTEPEGPTVVLQLLRDS